MGAEDLLSKVKKPVNFRLCKVSSHTTELLEILSVKPKLHILFIPGNPGVVPFYKDFLESLYELLGGIVSITAIGHISHTQKSWEHGKLFSLQEQIDHKINFIEQELDSSGIPIVLVGHSIGSHIAMETLRRYPDKVTYFIGLYPFLMFDPLSKKQAKIWNVARSSILCILLSICVACLGFLPKCASRSIVSKSMGRTWSATGIEAACSHLLRYHTLRNMLYMAVTEFRQVKKKLYCKAYAVSSTPAKEWTLSEIPDWSFMREKKDKMTFLFGVNDHWGPLEMHDEIAKQVPEIPMVIEREGHMHSFCCTVAGSVWVAQHVASLIRNQMSYSTQ